MADELGEDLPETVAPTAEASNPASNTSSDEVLALLRTLAQGQQDLAARLKAVESTPTLPVPASVATQVEQRNFDPHPTVHGNTTNGVLTVLHALIDKVGLGENDRVALHNAIPNVNPEGVS